MRMYFFNDPIHSALHGIKYTLENNDFNSAIGIQVFHIIEELESDYNDKNEEIPTETLESIEKNAREWESIIVEELKRENIISVDDSGILDAERLVNNPKSLFSNSVWRWLETRPQNDLTEACQNLAIGSSTSAVILSLRAVEDCLRRWYEIEMGEELEASWGSVLDELMEEFGDENKGSDAKLMDQLSDLPPVLSNLYYLKDKRNEVSHPEKSPNISEAQRTLIIVVSTIIEIHAEIQSDFSVDSISIELSTDYEDTQELILELVEKISEESPDGTVPRKAIYHLGEQIGLDNEEIENGIVDNLMDGLMYEPAEGTVRPI